MPLQAADPERVRRHLAVRDVPCPRCGYNLRGQSALCPECGLTLSMRALRAFPQTGEVLAAQMALLLGVIATTALLLGEIGLGVASAAVMALTCILMEGAAMIALMFPRVRRWVSGKDVRFRLGVVACAWAAAGGGLIVIVLLTFS